MVEKKFTKTLKSLKDLEYQWNMCSKHKVFMVEKFTSRGIEKICPVCEKQRTGG